MIYLDNAATTYPKPECVYNKLDEANRHLAFNAGRGESEESSIAMAAVEESRNAVASLLPNCPSERVVFTSSATDALNKIILGLDLVEGDVVYVSPFEHNAIIRPLCRLKEKGVKVKVIPFDKETWQLKDQETRRQFALDNPTAIFLSHISNVTGFELPFQEIFEMGNSYGSINVLDCAQSFGVFKIAETKNISYLVFAGHKSLYGSFGAAGFVVLNDHSLDVVVRGGTGSDSLNPDMPDRLPAKYEAGSLNVVAISSLSTSIKWLKEHNLANHERKLSEHLRHELERIESIKVFYPKELCTNGILSFAVEGHIASEIGTILQEAGFSVRTGYHCAPLVHDFIGSSQFQGTVRISFGAFNTMEDITCLIETIRSI